MFSCNLKVSKHFFSLHVVDTWNSQPQSMVTASSIYIKIIQKPNRQTAQRLQVQHRLSTTANRSISTSWLSIEPKNINGPTAFELTFPVFLYI